MEGLLPTQHKIDQVADIKDRIERSTIVIATDYRGLTVPEMQALRRKLREGGLELRVIKNSLLKLAAEAAGAPEVYELADGPTALAISYDDIVDAAKAIVDYARQVEGTLLTADALKDLTKIPPRPVLIAQFMGTIESPLVNFVALTGSQTQEFSQLLQALLQKLPGLLEARARQLESEAA